MSVNHDLRHWNIRIPGNSHQALSFVATRKGGGEGKQEGGDVGKECIRCSQKGIYGKGGGLTLKRSPLLSTYPFKVYLPATPVGVLISGFPARHSLVSDLSSDLPIGITSFPRVGAEIY